MIANLKKHLITFNRYYGRESALFTHHGAHHQHPFHDQP